MSRIVALGPARQDLYLIDRDDFLGVELDGQSIFSKISIGGHINIDKAQYSIGGQAANAAVTFARYGHETIFMGELARDVAGAAIIDCFNDENIDSSYTAITRSTTGCAVVLVDAKTHQHTTLHYDGASTKSSALDPADLDNIQPDWLYATTLGGQMEKLLEFFEHAHEIGAKVMFNPGPAEFAEKQKLIGLLDEVDVLVVNKSEAAQLVPGVVLAELLSHLANYCKTVLITDGIMGAIATNGQESYRLGIYEQGQFRDATGAGDAFGSGFLAEFAEHNNFEQALQYASANAAKVTQAYGAQAGILYGPETFHPMPIMQINNLTE